MTTYQKIILILLIGLFAFAFWPSENNKISSIDTLSLITGPGDNISIMGLTLNKSTLQEAEALINETAKKALFLTPLGEKKYSYKFEAYFEEQQVVLNFEPSATLIKNIEHNPNNPFVYPSGIIRLGISAEEMPQVNQLIILSLTYVPGSRIDLEMFQQHYQEPNETLTDPANNIHYLYPAFGLDFYRPSDGPDVLQFVLPKNFNQLRDPLIEVLNNNSAAEKQ